MSEPVVVEIFIIGNEILIGDIQDTNTNWLCREISNLGGYVARATALRDDAGVIAAEVRAALRRGGGERPGRARIGHRRCLAGYQGRSCVPRHIPL